SSFIKKTVLAKLILYSLLTQFNLHPLYNRLMFNLSNFWGALHLQPFSL
ncbi:hypothetical protein GUI30_25425, partial [Escherichia coli]|nr:hypothetical protein [Escherichia coli]